MSAEVPLREHLESQVRWLDRHIDARLAAVRDAIEKAESQLNRRLEGMNEFRESLRDQAGKLAARSEVEISFKNIEDKIRQLELGRANMEGRVATISWVVATATSIVVGVIIFLISRWLR